MGSIVNEKLEDSKPDIFVRAELGQFGVLEFYKFEDIYAAAAKAKEEFKRKCETVLAEGSVYVE